VTEKEFENGRKRRNERGKKQKLRKRAERMLKEGEEDGGRGKKR
jgi:hypothetical protein